MTELLEAQDVHPGDVVEDDCGEARPVARVEVIARWRVLHDGAGDALIVDPHQLVRVSHGS